MTQAVHIPTLPRDRAGLLRATLLLLIRL